MEKLKRFYMLVSDDKYELPLTAPMTSLAMSRKLGVKENTVRFMGAPSYKKRRVVGANYHSTRGYKLVTVMLEEEEVYD